MAKVSKVKKREPTVHSRAHRRNASPPPKDLAVKAPAAEASEYKPWLHNAQNAGISKRKKAKFLTRQQKVRREKALEKADANLDKLATKVKQSKDRGRRVQARAKAWEELNGGASAGVDGAEVAEDEGEEEEEGQGEEGGEAVELDAGMEEAEPGPAEQPETAAVATGKAENRESGANDAESTAKKAEEEDEVL